MNSDAMNYLLRDLNPSQRQEVEQFAAFVSDRAGKVPTGELIDGHEIKRIFQQMDPAVHGKIYELLDLLDVPRTRPYQNKMGHAEYAEAFGLDPDALGKFKSLADASDVIDGLNERMPAAPPPERSRRDDIADALQQHMPRAKVRRAVSDYTTNASEGLTLRQALKTIIDTTEQLDGTRYDPREATK